MLHRDEWRYRPYMTRDPEGPELTLAFMVALTDFTVENGATRSSPGSNHWPEGQRPDESQVEQAKKARGLSRAYTLRQGVLPNSHRHRHRRPKRYC